MTINEELVEVLADLEHQQWMAWSQAVGPEVSAERDRRWQKLWVPYDYLSEDMKEHDRKWARKAVAIVLDKARENLPEFPLIGAAMLAVLSDNGLKEDAAALANFRDWWNGVGALALVSAGENQQSITDDERDALEAAATIPNHWFILGPVFDDIYFKLCARGLVELSQSTTNRNRIVTRLTATGRAALPAPPADDG